MDGLKRFNPNLGELFRGFKVCVYVCVWGGGGELKLPRLKFVRIYARNLKFGA